jgi:hypothetical protein
MPGFLSYPFAAIASSLLITVFVHRLPFFGLQQELVRQSQLVVPPKQQVTAKADEIDCWKQPPPIWPRSLILVQKRVPDRDSRVGPATTVTFYDYDLGGNLIQITPRKKTELNSEPTGDVLWDLELNSGHSFYFTPAKPTCQKVDFPVGILRPNWLEGATPLGPSKSWDGSGRQVCGWTKVDFIDYYADAATGGPDSWYFHTMKATFQTIDYKENPSIDPALFVPPDYCR